ncbi:hypothetical protein HZU77_016535 [Neisseriaceae bacterium TC5R-5]|nr:hypothetical protein [Neisseriaceae bacterium TC5R-5]
MAEAKPVPPPVLVSREEPKSQAPAMLAGAAEKIKEHLLNSFDVKIFAGTDDASR